ncbi:MAG: hypothetical protein MZV63_12175 [Marinilabiliales bacterium]|nr:hypothetical protein [Marinilabiliales bacterium]
MLWLDLGIAAEADGRGKYDDDLTLWREKRRPGWMGVDVASLFPPSAYGSCRARQQVVPSC